MMRWANKPTQLIYVWIEREKPKTRSKAWDAAEEGQLRRFVESRLYFEGTCELSEKLAQELFGWILDRVDWDQLQDMLSEDEI